MYHETRGRELPGNYNHSLLRHLFHTQSSRWKNISEEHIQSVVKLVTRFLQQALKFVVKDAGVHDTLRTLIMATFYENIQEANVELDRLVQDEKAHLITYNHYYTDNVQKARQSDAKESVRQSVENSGLDGNVHSGNLSSKIERMSLALQNRVQVNMVDRACSEALTDLNAYYKVSLSHSPGIDYS